MDLLTFLLYVSLFAALIWLYLSWNEARTIAAFRERGVKYVTMGNLFFDIVFRRRIELKKDELIKKEGKIWGFSMLGRYTVLVAEPELIQTVVSKEFTSFTNRRPVPSADPIFSRILTLAENEKWKRLRSVMTPTFSAGKLKRMKPCIDGTIAALIGNCEDAIKKSSIVDVKHVIGAFTMDTIIQIAFGIKINSLIDPNNPIIVFAKRSFSVNFTFSNLFAFTLTFLVPKLANALKIRPNTEAVGYFEKTALEIIKKKRAQLKEDGVFDSKGTNFIELLLEAEVESQAEADGKSKFITNEEVVAQAVLFFIVGYDTTATTITMTAYHLALHPQVQERLHGEIVKVIAKLAQESTEGETDPIKLVTIESLSRFEYLNAVINESLRLSTPLLFLERVASKDFRLETSDGKTRIDLKKNDVVHVPAYSVHRDPDHFPDPTRFDPERFMTSEPTFHKYAFMPFGNGPRSCIAQSLARLEAKMSILHIIRLFKLSKCAQTKVPIELYYQSNFVIPKDVELKMEKR